MPKIKIESVVASACNLAKSRRHKYVTVEHLLLASLDNPAEKEQLIFWSVDVSALRSSLETFLQENIPTLPLPESGNEAQPTVGFHRVVGRVIKEKNGRAILSSLLESILYEHIHDSLAVSLLQQHGLAIALPQSNPDIDEENDRGALVDAHVDSAQRELEGVLAIVDGCNVPSLRGALSVIADWARFNHAIKDESVRKQKMLEMCNLFECLRVNSIEDRLEVFVDMLAKVDDADRQSLSQSLATLVLAPDSNKVKEDCLAGLAGSGAMGYKPKKDRDAAREVKHFLGGDNAPAAFSKARNKEMT